MNLALLSFEYPPETGYGGIGTYSYYQARALAKLGHRVHVIAGSVENGIYHSEHEGVRVTRIKRDGWLQHLLGNAKQKRCGWFANRVETAHGAYEALVHLLDKEHFDIVEMPECGADGMVVTTLLQVPTAIKYHSPARLIMDIYDVPRMDRELTAFAEQVAINQVDVHTSCSKFVADEVAAKMGVRDPIHVVPNGIDLELFDRDEGIDPHERFGVPKDGVTIFFANRMEERKGVHLVGAMALAILQKYPHAHFVLAGRDLFGYLEGRVLPAIRDRGLADRFHYLGGLDLPSVRAILKVVDIFLIPSLWENCPYSCLEAMTAGRAIVSSDCGGMPELIVDGVTGLLAQSGDAASYVSALEQVIEDSALRERLGGAARRMVEERLSDVSIAALAVETYQRSLDTK
ncbi:MAG: glycosyltransferase family 4 protein [Planctomycetota bacterium]